MNAQLSLIHQRNTWMHFIGGYYKSTAKFIDEAKLQRISRRAPAQQVRGMQFGDRLVFLRYHKKDVVSAFAEAQIVGVTLDHEIAKEVGDKLKEQGLAEYHEPGSGGGTLIQRECGSYMCVGSWDIKCELSEVMEMAIEAAKKKGEPLFVMVNAELVQTYESPTYLQPAPKFTRGFLKPADQAQLSITPVETVVEPEMWAIQNYQKAPRLSATN